MTKINQSNGKFWKAKIYSNDIITMSLLSLNYSFLDGVENATKHKLL